MRIVAFGDTHERHREVSLPECDVAVFVGDATMTGRMEAFRDFCEWYGEQDCDDKIMIGGNHDFCLTDHRKEEALRLMEEHGITYLEDNSVTICGKKFYGSPWTPTLERWCFQRKGDDLKRTWKKIPNDTDILVTHGPPEGVGDYIEDLGHIGDEYLSVITERIEPRFHFFGHVHEAYGRVGRGKFNVSMLDENYEVDGKPIVVEFVDEDGDV